MSNGTKYVKTSYMCVCHEFMMAGSILITLDQYLHQIVTLVIGLDLVHTQILMWCFHQYLDFGGTSCYVIWMW